MQGCRLPRTRLSSAVSIPRRRLDETCHPLPHPVFPSTAIGPRTCLVGLVCPVSPTCCGIRKTLGDFCCVTSLDKKMTLMKITKGTRTCAACTKEGARTQNLDDGFGRPGAIQASLSSDDHTNNTVRASTKDVKSPYIVGMFACASTPSIYLGGSARASPRHKVLEPKARGHDRWLPQERSQDVPDNINEQGG